MMNSQNHDDSCVWYCVNLNTGLPWIYHMTNVTENYSQAPFYQASTPGRDVGLSLSRVSASLRDL